MDINFLDTLTLQVNQLSILKYYKTRTNVFNNSDFFENNFIKSLLSLT